MDRSVTDHSRKGTGNREGKGTGKGSPPRPSIQPQVVAGKRCNRCEAVRPRADFYAMTSAMDGLQSCCTRWTA